MMISQQRSLHAKMWNAIVLQSNKFKMNLEVNTELYCMITLIKCNLQFVLFQFHLAFFFALNSGNPVSTGNPDTPLPNTQWCCKLITFILFCFSFLLDFLVVTP